jgi:hypothetical protein
LNDQILAARIDALARSLDPPQAPRAWPDKFAGANVNTYIWTHLTTRLAMARTAHLRELVQIRKKLHAAADPHELEQLWAEFEAVHAATETVFQESRDMLGGLAFRDKGIDERLCQVAEDIVLDWHRSALTPLYPALPGHEAVSRTLARIVRMRLPEWTVWTLPLVAHEYGRVIPTDEHLPGVHAAMTERIEVFARGNPDWAGPIDSGNGLRTEFLEKAEIGLSILIADAFAAWTMGPAYGFAAITLALNPAHDGYPSHALRGEVVLSVLERMEDEAGRPFADAAKYLREQWHALLRRMGRRPEPLSDAVYEIIDVALGESILAELRYPRRVQQALERPGEHGWEIAEAWAADWVEQLRAGRRDLTLPAVTDFNRTHDALNAAWRARVRISAPPGTAQSATALVPDTAREEAWVNQIGNAAMRLCLNILTQHGGGGHGDGGAPEHGHAPRAS